MEIKSKFQVNTKVTYNTLSYIVDSARYDSNTGLWTHNLANYAGVIERNIPEHLISQP